MIPVSFLINISGESGTSSIGTRIFVLKKGCSLFRGYKCIQKQAFGTKNSVLWKEVNSIMLFIQSDLYQRIHCSLSHERVVHECT